MDAGKAVREPARRDPAGRADKRRFRFGGRLRVDHNPAAARWRRVGRCDTPLGIGSLTARRAQYRPRLLSHRTSAASVPELILCSVR
jgi:hypothetical protein